MFDFRYLILVLAGTLILGSCTTMYVSQLMSKESVRSLVNSLPEGQEKTVALAVMIHVDTQYRIDQHGYPTWRWRGKNDIGGCVHINPKTKQPYLENQFPRSQRTDIPKYIDFGTDGKDWMCRIHKVRLNGEFEKNWGSSDCHQQGKQLLTLISNELNIINQETQQ